MKETPSGLFWRGKYASRKFGGIRLGVRCDGATSDSQRKEFQLFLLNEDQIFEDAQKQLVGIYNLYLTPNENDRFQSLENLGPLTKIEMIWEQLDNPFDGGTSLSVLRSRENRVFLKIGWECSWDIEHGVSVCIESGKVVSRQRWLELQ